MERSALRGPLTVGLKVTVMPQELPAPRLVMHVCAGEKSPELVPVVLILVMLSVVPPVLVSVVVWGLLVRPTCTVPKLRLDGTSFTVPTVRVKVTLAILVVSSTEVAVRVTIGLAGTVAGAA
jgi:hypothetical protein